MRKQTPVEPRVHTGVTAELGLQLTSPGSRIQLLSPTQCRVFSCPHAHLFFMPLSLILPWQTQLPPAPVPAGTGEVMWVHGWVQGDRYCWGLWQSKSKCPVWHRRFQVLTVEGRAWYGQSVAWVMKSQKSQFLLEISQAGQAKDNLNAGGHWPAACRRAVSTTSTPVPVPSHVPDCGSNHRPCCLKHTRHCLGLTCFNPLNRPEKYLR